jgi:probable HAF family extracellular repeat protein
MKDHSPVFLIATILLLSSFAAAQAYSVVNIGNGSPRALSSTASVAGVFETTKKPRQTHAFFWSKSGGFQDLGTLVGPGCRPSERCARGSRSGLSLER